MDPLALRSIGRTGLQVTRLGFGGATLGDARETIDEARAAATVEAAHRAGIGYFDTSPGTATARVSIASDTCCGRSHATPLS